MILIANRLCRSDRIVWQEVVTGRLVHCRLHLTPRPIDLVGIYQYPWNTSIKQKTCRNQIWNAFRQLLQELPARNTLCILGDFNCSLPSIPRLVGLAHFDTPDGPKLGPQHGDISAFSQILNDFQLVALNTWTKGLHATSFTPFGASRIDFIMVRMRDCDHAAKQVGQVSDAPYLNTGAFHIPIMTSVNYRHYRQARTLSHRFPRQVKDRCIDEFRQDSPQWQYCANGVNHALRASADLNDLPALYRILHQGVLHYFQTDRKTGSTAQMGFAEQKWQHYAIYIDHQALKTLTACFEHGNTIPCFNEWTSCTSGGSKRSSIQRSSNSPWRPRQHLSTMIPSSCTMLSQEHAPNNDTKELMSRMSKACFLHLLKRRQPM